MGPNPLSPEEASLWREADRIFDGLLDFPPEARSAALDRIDCIDAVRDRVRRLLREQAGATRLLEHARESLAHANHSGTAGRRGQQVGRWILDAEIGTGGMSIVYAAHEQDQPQRRVAVKVFAGAVVGWLAHERLQREQRALARLNHPHIVPLIETGILDDGTPWLAMGLVDGARIDRYCFDRQLDPAARVRIMIDVAEAVAHAHRALIVHRDLKPGNVLVDADGQVRLLDFGIAGLLDPGAERTTTQLHALTPEYAAPEQFDGAPPDTAMDVYGLGALLHRLLTGRAPGRRTSADTVATTPSMSIADEAYADPALRERARVALRGDLDAVLLKALDVEPARRYASASEFAADLRAWLEARPVIAQRPTLRYRVGRFVRRHRGAVGMAVAALLAVLTSLGIALWQAQRASAAARVAELRAEDAAREAARATAVSDFLVSLFGAAAAGTPTAELPTTAELLAVAERRIGDSFDGDPRMAGRLLLAIGEVNLSVGRLAEARALLEQAHARLRDAPDAEPYDRARLAIELARVHLRAGGFDAALARAAEARAYAAGMTRDDPGLNEEFVDVEVGALMGMGRAAEAVELAARHHAAVMANPQRLPVHVAGAAYNLGIARTAAGEVIDALGSLLEAEAAANGLQGQWELRLVIGNALATALQDNHRGHEALARRAQDLELMRQAYPTGHVRIGQALNNLGSSYNRVGRTTDGLLLIEEALPILIARLGDRHPSVASAYNNRGAALAALGRYDEALADYARARERIEPLATPGDRRLLTVLLNEAESLARMGRSADALERIERIEAAESGVPAALLDGASVVAAEALLRQGDGAGAANRARSVLDRSPDQPSGRRALAWVLLAEALQQQGDAAAARSALGDVDAEIERLGAEVDANALRAIREQTRLLLALELPGDAARTLSAHHARLSGLLGADDPRVRALADDMRATGAAPP